MTVLPRRAGAALALALLSIVPGVAAQAPRDAGIPTPYVPSTSIAVDEMLRAAGVGPRDFVVDLGSGDGRIVIAAARDYGARGLGIEIDGGLVRESIENARKAGVEERVTFRQGDVLEAEFSEATVVTLYLLPQLVEQLKPRLLRMRPGTRIVAHDFGFADWRPDRSVVISKHYHLYVVPARVGGKWRLEADLPGGARGYDFELEQTFQQVRGGARVPGGYLPAFEARVAGDRITFVLVEEDASHHFEGHVRGYEMEGTVRSGAGLKRATGRWRATRVLGVPDEG
ncbi:MAG: methyltransferase domain-containing protein [Burkholderiales bacterium]|nr:methyltransferase domain-containing protein [Burkholderiales bacterium]